MPSIKKQQNLKLRALAQEWAKLNEELEADGEEFADDLPDRIKRLQEEIAELKAARANQERSRFRFFRPKRASRRK